MSDAIQALRSGAEQLGKCAPIRGGFKGPCELCGGSQKVNVTDVDGKILLYCHGCQRSGRDLSEMYGVEWSAITDASTNGNPTEIRGARAKATPRTSNTCQPHDAVLASRPKPNYAPPTDADLDAWGNALFGNPERLTYLRTERGWTNAVILAARIGWNGERYTLPVLNPDASVNHVLRYLPGAERKMLAPAGCSRIPIGLEHLRSLEDGTTLLIAEGEPDALAVQSAGYHAIGVPGATNWKSKWATDYDLARFDCVAIGDADTDGKSMAAAVAASIPGCRVLTWPEDAPAKHDATDALLVDTDAFRVLVDGAGVPEEQTEFNDVALGRMSMELVGAADAAETKWFVEDFIPQEALVLIAARWKVGKSMLAYWAALQILKGVDVLGTYPVARKDLRVMIWQFEMPVSVNVKRLRKLSNGLRIKPETLVKWEREGRLTFYAQSPISLKDPEGLAMFHNRIDHYKPDIIFIDSAGEAGFNINDNELVREQLRAVVNPLQAAGRSVVLLTHKRKGQTGGKPGQADNAGDSIIGAQSWGAKASRIYTLEREGQEKEPGDFVVKLESQDGWDLTTHPAVYVRVYDACVGGEEATLLEPLDESQIQTEGYETKTDQAKRLLLEAVQGGLYGYTDLRDHLIELGVAKGTAERAYRDLTKDKKIKPIDGKIRSQF